MDRLAASKLLAAIICSLSLLSSKWKLFSELNASSGDYNGLWSLLIFCWSRWTAAPLFDQRAGRDEPINTISRTSKVPATRCSPVGCEGLRKMSGTILGRFRRCIEVVGKCADANSSKRPPCLHANILHGSQFEPPVATTKAPVKVIELEARETKQTMRKFEPDLRKAHLLLARRNASHPQFWLPVDAARHAVLSRSGRVATDSIELSSASWCFAHPSACSWYRF